jgi:hypothetical protein
MVYWKVQLSLNMQFLRWDRTVFLPPHQAQKR